MDIPIDVIDMQSAWPKPKYVQEQIVSKKSLDKKRYDLFIRPINLLIKRMMKEPNSYEFAPALQDLAYIREYLTVLYDLQEYRKRHKAEEKVPKLSNK